MVFANEWNYIIAAYVVTWSAWAATPSISRGSRSARSRTIEAARSSGKGTS